MGGLEKTDDIGDVGGVRKSLLEEMLGLSGLKSDGMEWMRHYRLAQKKSERIGWKGFVQFISYVSSGKSSNPEKITQQEQFWFADLYELLSAILRDWDDRRMMQTVHSKGHEMNVALEFTSVRA